MRVKTSALDTSRSPRRVLAGARVLDRDGSVTLADVAIVGPLIVDVGPDLDGDELLDLTGRTILPGLIDCHVHITFSHVDLWRHLQTPFSYRFYEAACNLRRTLSSGVTTVRDAAGADLGMKKALADGLLVGPRLLISIGMISQTGGHGDAWLASGIEAPTLWPAYPGNPSTVVDGPDEIRRKVRELVRAGADVIKVATTGGIVSPRDDPKAAHFSESELDVLVSEARAASIDVMAHAIGTSGVKAAIRAGIRSIEHGINLDDECIAMMLENGTFLVPTLSALAAVQRALDAGLTISEAAGDHVAEAIAAHRDSFHRAVDAGVRIAMGTDAGIVPHGDNLQELLLMSDCGMTPADCLLSATRSAAELLRLDGEIGAVEPGLIADLAVVSGDPFDLTSLSDRITVVQEGRVVTDRTTSIGEHGSVAGEGAPDEERRPRTASRMDTGSAV